MQESRNQDIVRKSTLVISANKPYSKGMWVKEEGQLIIQGQLIEERKEVLNDRTLVFKKIRLTNAEKVENKKARIVK